MRRSVELYVMDGQFVKTGSGPTQMKLLMEKQESTTPSSQGGPVETPRRFKFPCACPEPVLANDESS
jgi:hypothetical protein